VVSPFLSLSAFRQLQHLDTCAASNAIERLNVRLRNEGSVSGRVLRCQFPEMSPMLGYAVTGCIRSTSAPVSGHVYHENMNWWRYLVSIPQPRVMVLQDVDDHVGAGALVGELHAVIAQALECVGFVTNGAVRDLPAIEALGFHLFAGNVAVSHMYAHVSEYGKPVELGGLTISPGDLIHGDRHGIHIIPLPVASKIPKVAAQIRKEKRNLKNFCRSPGFSLERLDRKLQEAPGGGFELRLIG
jgi:4-hydroxy-4-methyl-2-oxoglutarate aldolase